MFSHVPLASPNSISEIAPEINCFTVLKNTIKQSRKQTTITTTFVIEDLNYNNLLFFSIVASIRFKSVTRSRFPINRPILQKNNCILLDDNV